MSLGLVFSACGEATEVFAETSPGTTRAAVELGPFDRAVAAILALPADDLLTEATGRSLDTGAFKRHLTRRYLDA